MTARDVLAIVYNRGLQPTVGFGGTLEIKGGLVSPTLDKVIQRHKRDILDLVACEWMPDLQGDRSESTPEYVVDQFDQEAERLVRDLYAAGYGIRWKGGEMRVFPDRPSDRLRMWMVRAKKLRDRLIAHVRPRDPAGLMHWLWFQDANRDRFGKEFYPIGHPLREVRVGWCDVDKGGDSRWHHDPVEHPFCLPFPINKTAWKFCGERFWRMPWGYWGLNGNRWEYTAYGSEAA